MGGRTKTEVRGKAGLGRFQAFLLASAVLISAAVVASGLVVGWFFERHVLEHEQEHTAKVVLTQALQHLTPGDFTLPGPRREGPAFAAFQMELPEVFRIKVFDKTGRIVWSDEPRLIGMAFSDNPNLVKALKGQVTTVLEVPRRSEHLYEGSKSYVAEAYVPIALSGSAELVGVIETYKDVTDLVLGSRRTRRLIWGFAAGTGLLLYATLAFVVWKASVNEQQAISRLEAQNRELAEAQAKLVEAERLAAVGQVVVGLHHAILNPLTGILGALQMLRHEGAAQPEKSEALAEAEAEIRKIERRIRRLSDLRRTESVPYVGGTSMLDLEEDRE